MFRVLLLCLFASAVYSEEKILVYAGPGVGPQSLSNTVQVLRQLADTRYTIQTVGPATLRGSKWHKDTVLLIFPGGADLPYVSQLRGEGTESIRDYVMQGGKFIGICAGAYFSADRIEFAKGDAELEITGERYLKFFPGLVKGPTFAGFHHLDLQKFAGTRAAKIYWQLDTPFARYTEFTVYYNGGGHFENPEQYSNVTVLAKYGSEAAIIQSSVGKGKAILSGPHFEQDPTQLDSYIEQLKNIQRSLLTNDKARLKLVAHLLERLDIVVKTKN